MRQKAANQITKKNFILYKGHTGWKIKTRIFGTLLVSLSAITIAESTGTINAHADTDAGSSSSSAEISPAPAPKTTGTAELKTPQSGTQSSDDADKQAPVTATKDASADTTTKDTPTKTTTESGPKTTTESTDTAPTSTAPTTEKVAVKTSVSRNGLMRAMPVAASAEVTDTTTDASTTQTSSTASQYQVLDPGQKVNVSNVEADGTVKLTASQIKDHFVGTVVNRSTSDANVNVDKNTHAIPIKDDGSVTLTSNDKHTYFNSHGTTDQVIGHQVAHIAFEHSIDFGHNFSMTGALGIGSNPDGADSVGIIFAPGNPGAATGGDSGRYLGLEGLNNAFGFVYDNYHNGYQDGDVSDPGTAAYFGWRTTTKYGILNADSSTSTWYDASKLNLNDQKTNPFNNFTMTYDAATKQLTVTLGGHDFTRTVSDTTSGYSIAIAASTGAKTNDYAARIDSFNYTPKTAQVSVKFTTKTDTPLQTASDAAETTVTANVGDTVLVFSSQAAAQRALEKDPSLDPNLMTVIPTDADKNVYVVDGSESATNSSLHYIGDDQTVADGAYYSYVVTNAADQSVAVPVSLTFKAKVTPVDQDGNEIPGIDPIEVNAVDGKSVTVQFPGFTSKTVTIPAPTAGNTTTYDLKIDMSKTATDGTTAGDGDVTPIAHYYTATGTTVDGKPAKTTVTVGTSQSVTDALNDKLATDAAATGITSDDYYWSKVPDAVSTDSTDKANPQDSKSILVPTKSTLDSWLQKAAESQKNADDQIAKAQDIYNQFVKVEGITPDQVTAAKKLLDSVFDLYNKMSDDNMAAKNYFEDAEAATDPVTIFQNGQDGYNALSSMNGSLDTFQKDLDNMTSAAGGSLASFVSWDRTYGTKLGFPDVTFGSDFGITALTETQKQEFDNPKYYYYVNALDSGADKAVDTKNMGVGTYYFKLTDAGRDYLKSLVPGNPNAGFYTSAALTITPAAATPTINDTSMVYGGQAGKLAGITGSLGSDLADAEHPTTQDEFEIVNKAGTVVPVNELHVGGDYTIRYTAAAQAALKTDTNYTFSDFGTAKLTVTPKKITLTAEGTGKTYGTKDPELTLTDSAEDALVNGDQLSDLGITLTRDTSKEDVGTYQENITGSASDSNKDYKVTVAPGTFTITPATITPTIQDTSVVYGGNDGKLGTITGSMGSDKADSDHPVTQDEFEIVDKAGNVVAVNQLQAGGDYTIRYTAAAQAALKADGNYKVSDIGFRTAKLTVTPRKITVTAPTVTKTYGDKDATFELTGVSEGELVNNDQLSDLGVTLERVAGEDVGTYTISKSAASNKNYTITVTPGSLKIDPKPVTVTAKDVTATYDGTAPKTNGISVPAYALVGDDTEADLGVTLDPISEVNAGTYTGAVRGTATSKNYAVTVNSGTVTISKKPITVQINNSRSVYGQPDSDLTFSIPATTKDGTINGKLVGQDTQDKLGVTLTREAGTDVKDYVISGTAADNTNYDVTIENGTYTIAPAAGSVTVGDAKVTYGDMTLPQLSAKFGIPTGSKIEQADFEIVDANGKSVSLDKLQAGGNYKIQLKEATKAQLAKDNGNYDFTDAFGTGTLTVAKRPVTVQIANQEIDAGTANPQNTAALTRAGGTFKDGETVADLKLTYNEPTSPAVGTYAIDATNGNSNYDVTVLPGQLKVLGKTTDANGNTTITEKDTKGNVVKIDKQWSDGSHTTYTYDPTTDERTVTEQQDGKQVDQQKLTADAPKATLTDNENTATVVTLDPETKQPTFEHDTTQTTTDKAGNVTATTKDTDGNVVKVTKQWTDGGSTTYTYDQITGKQAVTEQKDGKQVDQKAITPDATKATLSSGDGVKTIVEAKQPGAEPTFEHNTTTTTTDKSGNVTATTKDESGNVIQVTKQWTDGSQTTYTYDPATGKQTVTEQRDGKQVDQKTITADEPEATLASGDGVKTVVNAEKPGAEPTFEHDTTTTTTDKAGNVTATTKDANDNVIKVTKQWTDGSQTTYTYDPTTGKQTVTEQRDGKQVDQKAITADDPKATLASGDGVKTIVDAKQPGAEPTFEHNTTQTTTDKAGDVTTTTTDKSGNVIKVTKQWTDGGSTTYTYDPTTGKQTVTEQKDGQTVDQKAITPDKTTATLSAGKNVETIVTAEKPGAQPTFEHETTQTTTDKAGNVTATTKDTDGNTVKVVKQWTDGSQTTYTYDPTTGKQAVTEQRDGKQVDQKAITADKPEATLASGKGVKTIVNAKQPGAEPTFEHNTTQTTTDKAGNVTTTTKDADGNVIEVTKKWTDGGATTYTYDPTTGKQTVTEQKDGKQVDQKAITPDKPEATLASGKGVETTVTAEKPGAQPTFDHETTQTTTDKAGNVTATTKDADGNVTKVVKKWTDGSQTTYTYDPTTGKQTVTEQKNGQTVDQKTITPDKTTATLSSGDGVKTIVTAEKLGAQPTFDHETTQTTTDKSGNVTTTTKDADGNVIKVVKQWNDGGTTTYTYDPTTGKRLVTEQKDGKQVDQKTIAPDATQATLSAGEGVKTIVNGKLGDQPTFDHETTQTTKDKAGNVTAVTKDADGNVIKVVKQWTDGSTATYTYDPATDTRKVTEQRDGQTVDQKTIAPDATKATLASGKGVETIVNAGKPGAEPTFEHLTTQTTTDKSGNVTATTKDANGNVIKVTKQWTDGERTIYTYDPATGQRTVTEQRNGKTIDQQTIAPNATEVTLVDGDGGKIIVKFGNPGTAPTFTRQLVDKTDHRKVTKVTLEDHVTNRGNEHATAAVADETTKAADDVAVNGHVKAQKQAKSKQQETELPQTGQKNESLLARLGVVLLALLSMLPFTRRRSH